MNRKTDAVHRYDAEVTAEWAKTGCPDCTILHGYCFRHMLEKYPELIKILKVKSTD